MAALAVFFVLKLSQSDNNEPPAKKSASDTVCLKTADNTAGCNFTLSRALTKDERVQGLSGRESLPQKTGMLFVFDEGGQQCMWMKDMRFSIDMLWLNRKKEIIKIQDSAAPETYPDSFCAPDTKYVIELNGGDAKLANLAVGQLLIF